MSRSFCGIRQERIKMPTTYAHDLFGQKVYRQMPEEVKKVIRRTVGYREYTIASFCFQRYACFLKKLHDVLGCKGIEGAVQKFGVGHHCLEQFFRVTVICNITASLSCNIHFLSKLLIFFQDVDFMVCSCQENACHHSGSPAAYDQYFTHIKPFTFLF